MDSGRISVGDFPGGLDLQATIESGQTYLWWRPDGETYAEPAPSGGDAWYATTHETDDGQLRPLRVRQRGSALEWEAPFDAAPVLERRLRLTDDLPAIRAASADDPVVERAYDAFWGMRLVEEPVFPTLVTFICSAQMRVERIFRMQMALRRELGPAVTVDGTTYHGYPSPTTVAATSEAELRDLGLGYRAPYVRETARMVAEGEVDPGAARSQSYETARDFLTQFVGVGDKVADCVCLFALDHLEAVPLDTWIRKAIAAFYPDCDHGNYADTSRAIRDRLGGDVAGYAQTYLFHYLRHADEEPAALA